MAIIGNPSNWDNMTQEEKEKWTYINFHSNARYSQNIREASNRLIEFILDDTEFSKIKISEIEDIFERTKKILKACYGQVSLQQVKDNIENLPEDEISYSIPFLK